jgi:methylated-DNA-protein-cysteine methyltransferase-like protein
MEPSNYLKKMVASLNERHKDFFQAVFEIVRHIPKGRATSYGAIAKCLGTPKSSRMVGWAMNASHKQEEFVPAHRVVNRNGLLTGRAHFNPPSAMQTSLEQEGHVIKDHQIQNFPAVFWDPSLELTV